MPTFASQRGTKAEEATHLPLETNLIGTLEATVGGGPGSGLWLPGPNQNVLFTLNSALRWHHNAPHHPLLWAFSDTAGVYVFKFGFDTMVASQAVGALPGAQQKIGHVALTSTATISGEIIYSGGHWEIDNNSGAWGSMGNNDGKTRVLMLVANLISTYDPGGIVVNARRAYSRTGWKRAIQQIFR